MADNVTLNAGSGGSTIAADDIGSVLYPRSKLIHGADGTNDGDVSTANPFPVRLYVGTTTTNLGHGTAAGAIRVELPTDGTGLVNAAQSGTWNVATVTTVTTVATVTTCSTVTSLSQFAGNAINLGAGAVGTGTLRTTLASDDPAVASLSVIDDWDSSDRCKVSPISGQDGVAGGSGVVGATTQRVVLATDVALPTGSNVIGAVTQSGTWNVGTVTTVTTVSTLTGGGVAHDGADSGNPHKVGAKATTALHSITPVADADRTDLYAGADGVLITRENSNLESLTSGQAAITDGSSTSVISAAGVGIKIYITDVIIANSSASNVTVDLRDGTGGSVKATFPVPANGGVVLPLRSPLGFSANTAVAADPSAAASTVTVTLLGFKSKV